MPIAEALSTNYCMHMIDLPGIGRSEGLAGTVKLRDAANWLNDYIEVNDIKKVDIIGHSLGGIIGLAYASYYPDKVNRLVLLDTGYSKIKRFPVEMIGSAGYFLPLISLLQRVFGSKVLGNEPAETEEHSNKKVEEEEVIKTIERLGLEDNHFIRKAIQKKPSASIAGLSMLLAAYRSNLPKMVKNLAVPCLILYGNRNNKPHKIQARLKRQVKKIKEPNHNVIELNGGHYAHVTDPKAVHYITSFLA